MIDLTMFVIALVILVISACYLSFTTTDKHDTSRDDKKIKLFIVALAAFASTAIYLMVQISTIIYLFKTIN